MIVRNAAYDGGVLRTHRLPVPVISVGNLTAGGTGKTPLVEYLARYCLGRGWRPAVVSRGYRRSSHGVVVISDGTNIMAGVAEGGDEPLQIAASVPGTVVVVGERRSEAGTVAVRRLGAEIVLLDDGFQHRALARDLDIVVLRAEEDPAGERLLPAGLRREPMSALGRAGFVLRSRRGAAVDRPPAVANVNRWFQGPLGISEHVPAGCLDPEGNAVEPGSLTGTGVFAFCGIAGPEAFMATVARAGMRLVGDMRFPDHHVYRAEELEQIAGRASAAGAQAVVTTEKDFARLAGVVRSITATLPLLRLQIRLRFIEGEEAIHSLVERCMAVRRH